MSINAPRVLIALNVNDLDALDATVYDGAIDVRNARSTVDVQRQLALGRHAAADLFLVDIDMRGNGAPEGLDWGDSEMRPFGPLLALPFLGAKGVSVFVPYSSYWGTSGVANNGFVLVAVSLLLAQIHGRPFSLTDVRDFMSGSSGPKRELVQEADTALRRALVAYRERISTDKGVELVDVDILVERLQALEESGTTTGTWPLSHPLADAEGLLALELCYASGETERIQLSSLLGDLLDFKPVAEQGQLEDAGVWAILDTWKSRSVVSGRESLYQSALSVLDACHTGTPANKVARASEWVKSGRDAYQLIRLVMCLAWVRAWREEAVPARRPERIHTLLGLFDTRTQRVDPNAATLYKRFLGVAKEKRVEVCAEDWRGSFWQASTGAGDAYKLDRDQTSLLTGLERSLCVRFAMDELDWDAFGNPAETRYPTWMA